MKQKRTWVVLTLIVLGGAFLRLWALHRFPPGLHFDEAVYGLLAIDIYHGELPVFFSAFTGREPLYMYLMAGIFRVVGINTLGIRLTSALIGIVTLPLAYLLFKELFSKRVGMLTAALTAIAYWHITISRNGYPNILIPPLECLALFFLWRGYRDGRRRAFALGGFFTGAVLYTYLAARLFPITLLLFFGYLLLVDRKRFTARFGGLLLAAGVALLVFAPLGHHFITHPHDFWERADQVLAVRHAEEGEMLRVYADNARQTLGAFFLRGDPRQHYNLPGKPIFGPLSAFFFLLGLGIALRHWREPAYALLPIWVVGMSLPALLTVDLMPQGQRMSGMIPGVFGIAALGLDGAYGWARARLGQRYRVLPALALSALVLFEGGLTAHTYFNIWGRQAATYHIFDTPYTLIAEEAAAIMERGDVAVIQSYHYKHPTPIFLQPRTHDAIWTFGSSAFVIPQREGEIFYLRPSDMPALQSKAEAIQQQTTELVERQADPDGELSFARYRLLPGVREQELSFPVRATFSDEIAVLDWSVPASARRDETLSVLVHWRVLRPVQEGRRFSIHLFDEEGTFWGQIDMTGYLSEQWRTGDTIYQQFELSFPREIPAGRYQLRLIVGREEGGQLPVLQNGELRATSLQLDSVWLEATGGRYESLMAGAELEEMRVLDVEIPGALPPDGRAEITLRWQAARAPTVDHEVLLEVLDDAGNVVEQQLRPLAYQYPTTDWRAGEVVLARYSLSLRDLESGSYTFRVSLRDSEGELELGPMTVDGTARLYEVPPLEYETRTQFGAGIELLGYDLPEGATHAPGGTLPLRLYWRAQAALDADYKVFLHLVDLEGHILAQNDAVPAQWQRPTLGWAPGEIVVDTHELLLPAGTPPGTYQLLVGVYDSESLQRLPIEDALPGTSLGDRLSLLEITVAP